MKIIIEIDENLKEEEVIIRCQALDSTVENIQKAISSITLKPQKYVFYKDDREFYMDINNVLFFDTYENNVLVHTVDDVYKTKYRLYELEKLLPDNFLRISKSSILNINHIYSISKNLSSASNVQFHNSHKQVYVSRHYFKYLVEKLEEKRMKL